MASSIWEWLSGKLPAPKLIRFMRLYPPFLGAGIRVTDVSEDFRSVSVEMPLTPLNRNYLGTQFGGSLYSMCDPFFMIMLHRIFAPECVVWDKGASIRFVKPGRGRVRATFVVDDAAVAKIRGDIAATGRSSPEFDVDIVDDSGELIAKVHKIVSVKHRSQTSKPVTRPASPA